LEHPELDTRQGHSVPRPHCMAVIGRSISELFTVAYMEWRDRFAAFKDSDLHPRGMIQFPRLMHWGVVQGQHTRL
jgi:hypothetical protein